MITRLFFLGIILFYSVPLLVQNTPVKTKRTFSDQEIECLVKNVYHEARGEGFEGMLAVANVTLNRLAHKAFPSTICKVVYQPYQFSWTLTKGLKMTDRRSVEMAKQIALYAIASGHDMTNGSIYFHVTTIRKPKWTRNLSKSVVINQHTFYKAA